MKKIIIYIILISALMGCAMSLKYYNRLDNLIVSGKYPEAVAAIKGSKEEYGTKNALLYYLDYGLMLHIAGQYEKSNQIFHKADILIDELYTKSLTKEAASFMINDLTRPYYGEDFEKVLVNLFSAMNYVYLGMWDDALVEARKVDLKLIQYNEKYAEKSRYREDAFIRYLIGMIYEQQGEINDAFISYIKALEIYKGDYAAHYGIRVHPDLVNDCLRTARAMGFYEEIERLEKEFPSLSARESALTKGRGEVILLHYNGRVPVKVEDSFQIAFGKGFIFLKQMEVTSQEEADVNNATNIAGAIAGDVNISISFPKFKRRDCRVSSSRITVKGAGHSSESYVAEDLTAIAIKDMEDRMGRIKAKTIARAVVKYSLAYAAAYTAEKEAEKRMGGLGGAITGFIAKKAFAAGAAATEHADTRGWRTLPAEIGMARLSLKPGTYDLEVSTLRGGGYISERVFNNVPVRKGERVFLALFTPY